MATKKDELSRPLALALLEKLKEIGVGDVTDLISDDDEIEQEYDTDYIEELRTCYIALSENVKFEKGQIVKWKNRMQNKRLPKKNQPAIVVATLDEPIFEDKAPVGSTYYKEPLDIILGVFHDDGGFLTFYHDSRRFELYKDSKKNQEEFVPRTSSGFAETSLRSDPANR